MAQSITEGLFPSVAGLFSSPGAEQARRLELAAQPVSPLNAVSGDIGFLGERMRQGIGSAFGQMPEQDRKRMQAQQAAQELQQQGVDVSTPEGLLQLAQRLDSLPGFTGESLAIRQAAAQMAQQRQMQGLEQDKIRAQTGLAQAQTEKAGRETGPRFSNPAEQALFDSFLAETGGDAMQASRKMTEYKSGLRQREAAAGVPEPGQVKPQDIKVGVDIVNNYTKEPSQRLGAVRQLRVSLSQTKGGTGAALPQLKRDLVKLVGDNQIGQNEVQQALGSIGIVGDAISGINQLLTGTPSPEKLKDVEKFINALEKAHAQSYNASRSRAEKVLSEARYSPETVKSMIPPAYEFKGPASKSKFVEGKIYKDAQGNRARYVNGKFEPVQIRNNNGF